MPQVTVQPVRKCKACGYTENVGSPATVGRARPDGPVGVRPVVMRKPCSKCQGATDVLWRLTDGRLVNNDELDVLRRD